MIGIKTSWCVLKLTAEHYRADPTQVGRFSTAEPAFLVVLFGILFFALTIGLFDASGCITAVLQ
jgi:hypothetical protein